MTIGAGEFPEECGRAKVVAAFASGQFAPVPHAGGTAQPD
jgi:hypothetical protein